MQMFCWVNLIRRSKSGWIEVKRSETSPRISQKLVLYCSSSDWLRAFSWPTAARTIGQRKWILAWFFERRSFHRKWKLENIWDSDAGLRFTWFKLGGFSDSYRWFTKIHRTVGVDYWQRYWSRPIHVLFSDCFFASMAKLFQYFKFGFGLLSWLNLYSKEMYRRIIYW